MWQAADMGLWTGRQDAADGPRARRWHQGVRAWDHASEIHGATLLLGFACDLGVRRNQGRAGALAGPESLRRALAGLALHDAGPILDGGDVHCEGEALEAAQQEFADRVRTGLDAGARVLGIGGGHEIAWASFMGVAAHLGSTTRTHRVGLINFDAHFDLRGTSAGASSGTPYRQVSEWCAQHGDAFRYAVLGISPVANTAALFDVAGELGVRWVEDTECHIGNLPALEAMLGAFLDDVDTLVVSVCLDAFPAAVAPGVSAPAALGIDPLLVIGLLRWLGSECRRRSIRWPLAEIAELCPPRDPDGRTARLAARIAEEMRLAQQVAS